MSDGSSGDGKRAPFRCAQCGGEGPIYLCGRNGLLYCISHFPVDTIESSRARARMQKARDRLLRAQRGEERSATHVL